MWQYCHSRIHHICMRSHCTQHCSAASWHFRAWVYCSGTACLNKRLQGRMACSTSYRSIITPDYQSGTWKRLLRASQTVKNHVLEISRSTTALHTMTCSNGIATIGHNQTKIWGVSRKWRSTGCKYNTRAIINIGNHGNFIGEMSLFQSAKEKRGI